MSGMPGRQRAPPNVILQDRHAACAMTPHRLHLGPGYQTPVTPMTPGRPRTTWNRRVGNGGPGWLWRAVRRLSLFGRTCPHASLSRTLCLPTDGTRCGLARLSLPCLPHHEDEDVQRLCLGAHEA